MAHGTDKKHQVRDSYVNGLLSLTAAAACVDVAVDWLAAAVPD